MSRDPRLTELRDRVSETDRAILDLVNRRLELVQEIRRHKAELGLPFLDPTREAELLAALRAANTGPLSADGVERLFRNILELLKQEAGLS